MATAAITAPTKPKVLKTDDVQISKYDVNQLRSLEIDSICAIQDDGRSTNRVLWNLQTAFRQGFTCVNRGEAEGQEHPPKPDWMTDAENYQRWNELHAKAAKLAAHQYYLEYPNEKPENWDLNATELVTGMPGELVMIEDGKPRDNSYVWAFVRDIGWHPSYYRALDVLPWEIFQVQGRQRGGYSAEDAHIAAFVQINELDMPDWNMIAEKVYAEAAVLKPLMEEVREMFPDACDLFLSGSQAYELYVADPETSHVITSDGDRVVAWTQAVKWAKSPAGKRLAKKMRGA